MTDTAITGPRSRPRRRRWIAVTAAVLAVVAGTAAVEHDQIGKLLDSGSPAEGSGAVTDNGSAASTQTARRRDLTAQQTVSGSLGYAGSYGVAGRGQGTLTWLPAVGQVISQGQAVYQSNGVGVPLLYGSAPSYRDLSENMTGADVTELNAALVSAGYASTHQIDPASDVFNWETKAAVERLQAAVGATQDGVLHLGQAVFLPTALRVTTVQATLGASAGGPILQGTSTTRQVTVALDATEQSQVKAGDAVVITLPNNQTTPGVVSSVGTVATAGSNGNPATVAVLITPSDPTVTGSLDQAPVQVLITTQSAPGALVVPVTALLSLAGGGYAVEVIQPGGAHKLVAVTPGLFDDAEGLVQVTDTALQPGERVVVAGS